MGSAEWVESQLAKIAKKNGARLKATGHLGASLDPCCYSRKGGLAAPGTARVDKQLGLCMQGVGGVESQLSVGGI